MKYGELVRKLRRLGCYPTRFGAGSHEVWRNPATGLLVRILRQLGIKRDRFDGA